MISGSECVRLEAAKLTRTSPPSMELIHAVFTSESFLAINGRLIAEMASRFSLTPQFHRTTVSHFTLINFSGHNTPQFPTK